MSIWTVKEIEEFYRHLNLLYGFNVNPNIIVKDKNKFALCRQNFKNMVFVPAFFNHELMTEDAKKMLLLCLFSSFHLDKNNDGHLDINPWILSKGICKDLNLKYISYSEIEAQERLVRRKLYDDTENGCFFSIGEKLREAAFQSYVVVDIRRQSENETNIIVKPIGCNSGKPEKVFSEEELFERCCNFPEDISKIPVSTRKNIIILSGPPGVGKTEVFRHLKMLCPDINKTVTVTTKKPEIYEKEGVDYYFVSDEEFYDLIMNCSVMEYTMLNHKHYATYISEPERYPENEPLFMIIRPSGRLDVLKHYPLAKTIYIEPPTAEDANSSSYNKTDKKDRFDYVLTNNHPALCAEEILKIIGKI